MSQYIKPLNLQGGQCSWCGKYGHKRPTCPLLKERMTFDHSVVEQQQQDEESVPSSILFNNDMLRWQPHHQQQQQEYHHPTTTTNVMPLQAVVSTSTPSITSPTPTNAPVPTVNTTNPNLAPPPPMLDPTKQYHPEWGVIKEGDFHALTLKHQRDLENHYQTNNPIADFYFWQANLGGYCMADMVQGIVVSSEGAFVLERKIVEGAPHPGRRKKKRGLG